MKKLRTKKHNRQEGLVGEGLRRGRTDHHTVGKADSGGGRPFHLLSYLLIQHCIMLTPIYLLDGCVFKNFLRTTLTQLLKKKVGQLIRVGFLMGASVLYI
jgi:hypothetical protein